MSALKSTAVMLGALLGALMAMPAAHAQEGGVYTAELVERRVSESSSIGALGEDLFGEKIDWYSGSSSFSIADVSLPGNNGLPVTVGRTHHVGTQGAVSLGLFGNWDIDIPYLSGTFGVTSGWASAPCSAKSAPPDFWVNGAAFFLGGYYWGGNRLHIPGGGDKSMLLSKTALQDRPQDGRDYPWMTADNWYFACVPLKRGSGEGFLAISPDGVRYYFDVNFYRETAPLIKSWFQRIGENVSYTDYMLYRRTDFLYPSRVEDRHGNSVDYNWDMTSPNDARLHSIVANDGRRIDIKYKWIEPSGYIDPITKDNGYKVESITANGRVWSYEYAATRALLTKVTLPDKSFWTLSPTFAYPEVSEGRNSNPCNGTSWKAGVFEYTMTHPSGAQGKFLFATTRHGRANVYPKCDWDDDRRQDKNRSPGKFFMTVSLVRKELSGPGVTPRTWTVERSSSAEDASWLGENKGDTVKTVAITDSAGEYIRYTFSNYFGQDEGMLLKKEIGASASQIAAITEHSYDVAGVIPSYTRELGISPGYDGRNPLDGKVIPLSETKISQDGMIFRSQVDAFDLFARPTRVTRSSAPAPSSPPPPPPEEPPVCSGCEIP